MADENVWRNGGKILFRSLCTAGGILAPALAATEPSLEKIVPLLAAGALGMFGSWRVNLLAQDKADRDRASLSEASVLLRNQDLNRLVTEALKLAIRSAAEEKSLAGHRKLIEKLAGEIPEYFQNLQQAPPDALSEDNLPNIAMRLAHAPSGGQSQSQPAQDTWGPLLDDLAQRLNDRTGFDDIRTKLANHIELHFDSLVVAVFKEDATGRGPSQGRGWAALTLLFWGRLLSDVRSIRAQLQADNAELRTSLQQTESRLALKLDELVRWHGPLATDQSAGLAPWLKAVHQQLAAKLDEVSDLVGHGLLSPEEFRLAYWTRRRRDPGLDLLWQDSARAGILVGDMVGRAKEVEEFDKFLNNSAAPWVLFWKGWPGTGKSRLMIEFAERATAAGRRVFFVSADVHDLKAALLRVRSPEPVVLLWDDYQGDKPDALRVFLELQRPPGNPRGEVVKRVITSWPTQNVLGEKARDGLYIERELLAITSSDDFVSYVRRLVPKLSESEAQRLIEAAEGQPEAVLRAVLFVLEGKSIDDIPPDLLAIAYDDLIRRLVAGRSLAEQAAVKRALLAIALVGRVNLGRKDQQSAFEAAGISDEALGTLVDTRTVSREGEVCSLGLDSFRAHVVRRSLDHQRPDVISGTPRKLAELARPLLAKWFHKIWEICVLASKGTGHGEVVRKEILGALDSVLDQGVGEWSDARAALIATGIFYAATVEPDPRQVEALANRIGELLARHDTPEIALRQAEALYNATVGEPDPRQVEALANRIGELLTRHDTSEIALEQAKALFNVTVGEPDPRQVEALANRIGELLSRHNTPEIALEQAGALLNATVVEPDPRQREALDNRIGELLARHDTPEIALQQAQALCNATVDEPGPRQREAPANRIGDLLARHNTPEIALLQAEALCNATAVEPDPHQCEALANRIGDLLARQDSPEIAFQQAKALFNATVVEPDPRQREALANRIGELLARHGTPEIALQQAKALVNATVGEPDPRQREALANRIGELLARHGTPEIALGQAMALVNATAGEPDPRQREVLANRIGELLTRHGTPEIALQQAKALFYATVGEPDPRQREALANRIGELLARHDTPDIALRQAKALFSATVVEPDPGQREALANRIGELLARHDTPEIALRQAKALCNATEGEPDPGQREALANRIGELLTRHDTPEIALQQAGALFNATVVEPNPRQREALANRIGELLAQHDTPEIALQQARALVNAAEVEPDPEQKAALTNRIGDLRAKYGFEL